MLESHKKDLQIALQAHRAGRIDQAQKCYEQLQRLYPSNFDVVHLLGLTCFQLGDLQRGAALVADALRLNPKSPSVHNSLGNICKVQGQLHRAKESFDKALELRSDYPEALVNRGSISIALGLLEGALSDFQKALRILPNYPEAHIGKGLVLKHMGRLDEALQSFDAAIAINPRDPEAMSNKGNLLVELARPGEAAAVLEIAGRMRPNLSSSHFNLGNAYLACRRFPEALASYDKAISLKPDHAEAYSNRGNALKALERLDEALASYDKAIGLKPGYAEAHSNRGIALKALKRLDEALASIDKAISLNADFAEAHSSRGNVLRELERLDEALASYDKAIGLKPDYAPAWAGLAQIASETGQFEEAQEKYQKAHFLDPKAVTPLCGIAEVKKFDSSDPLIREFQEILSDNSLSDEDRARLHHAYAKICSDLGHYDDAVEHYALGKGLMKSTFDVGRHSAGYASMKRLFTREFFAERSEFGLPDERPVFVIGMPRSGTTLTEQILASHHLVDGLGERQDIPQLAKKWFAGPRDSVQFANAFVNLKPVDVNRMAESYLEGCSRSRKQCIRVIDKRPHNYEWLGLIALMFPNARIIHCRRSPLDNCVSMYMQNFNESHGYNQDFAVLGRYYLEYVGMMEHWAEELPLPIHDCVYETTVNDFEASARSLVSFLGLEWDPNCLDYHQQNRQVSTPSRWQVRQPLYDKSVGRWRHYEKHLGRLKVALGIS
jgi:tetratricopeptide (TPR) repeat protein